MKCIFISARTESTRLPQKALLDICGKPSIQYLIENMKNSVEADEIILCTTLLQSDDELCNLAQNNNIKYFRGSTEDKLERWHAACRQYNVDFFVSVDGDDLFCDYGLADLVFKQFKNSKSDFIDGRGLYNDVYGITYDALNKVCKSKQNNDTEFIKLYFESQNNITVEKVKNIPEIYKKKNIRMTLDYQEDLLFFETIIKDFSALKLELTFKNVLAYVKDNQHLKDINWFRESDWISNQNKMIENIKLKFVKEDY
jgi:spore coat polysaccharide biosynthesis protein SpsF